jgi:hypothetical protein
MDNLTWREAKELWDAEDAKLSPEQRAERERLPWRELVQDGEPAIAPRADRAQVRPRARESRPRTRRQRGAGRSRSPGRSADDDPEPERDVAAPRQAA